MPLKVLSDNGEDLFRDFVSSSRYPVLLSDALRDSEWVMKSIVS